jgi:hypothetical protein
MLWHNRNAGHQQAMTKTDNPVSFGLEEKNILLVCLLPVDMSAHWFFVMSCHVLAGRPDLD